MTSWVCSEGNCNKTFRRRYHLLRHKSNVHTRSRPHSCPTCYRAFARKDALLRHQRFHAENPFWSGSRSAQLSTAYETDEEECESNASCEEDSTLIDHPIPLTTDADSSASFGRLPASNSDQISNASVHSNEPRSITAAPLFLEPPAGPSWESLTPLTTDSMMELGSDHGSVDLFARERDNDLSSVLQRQAGVTKSTTAESVNTRNLTNGNYSLLGNKPRADHFYYPLDEGDILRIAEANIPIEYGETIQKLCAVSFLQSYFASLHHQWSLIHEDSFWARKPPLLLKCAVGLLGLLLSPNHDKSVLRSVSGLNSWLRKILRDKIQQATPDRKAPSIAAYQTYLLTILFSLYLKDSSEIAEARSHIITLVDQIRRAGLLDFETIVAQDDQIASPFSRWVVREEKQRLVFSTFRLDCYLQILDDLPPTMRFQELCLPFPCTDKAWNSSKDKWKETISQEPSNRTSSTYGVQCFLAMSRLSPCSRLNLPGFRTISDFELGLVSMQARSWEETQHPASAFDGFAAGQDAPDHLIAGGFGQSWPVLWGIWHVTMEQFRSSHMEYCPHPSEKETYLTSLLLYHASLLRVYVDMKILQRLVISLTRDSSSNPVKRQMESLVQDWARSGRAKDALWHAAQILRLHSENAPELHAQNIPINPVAMNCVFRAGLVVWAISRSSQNCGLCAPGSTPFGKVKFSNKVRPRATSSGSMELTTIDNLTKDYELWLEEGDGELLVEGVIICACQMAALVEKFRKQIQDPSLGSSEIPSYAEMLDRLKDHG